MADDSAETKLTTDPEKTKEWARDAGVAPVREEDTIRFVDQGEVDETRHDRIDWANFGHALEETDSVVLYREYEERPAMEIHSRDDMRAQLDDDGRRHLDAGRVLSRPTGEIGLSTEEHEAMTPERVRPSDEDEGKTVVDTEGTELGVVTAVEGTQLYVDPDPGVTESVLSKLGWGDANEDDYVLSPDEIALIDQDRVEVKTP